ncbi:MAG: hypothetical protein QNJ63_12090 [Calothrix sp. MO_192.B10]|nr:hypothetical protein [Calothrix sp. MO_192.B10]
MKIKIEQGVQTLGDIALPSFLGLWQQDLKVNQDIFLFVYTNNY